MPRRGEIGARPRTKRQSGGESFRSNRAVLLLVGFAALIVAQGCGGDSSTHPPVINNNPPVIERMYTIPPRVHAAEEVTVLANITDADNDRLTFRWTCTRGTLPDGNVQGSTTWQTPSTRGRDTLRVRVADAADTVIGFLTVDLLLPGAPPRVTLINASSLLEVHWDRSLDQGINGWQGYEIFVADHSLAGLSDEQVLPFRLRDTPFNEPSLALRISRLRDGTSLRVGTKYFVHLRSLRSFEGMTERSEPSVEVNGSPRPEWVQAQFTELNHRLGASALDLSTGRMLSLDPADASGIASRDLYLDGGIDGALELRSVSRLSEVNPAWSARAAQIKPLGEDWEVSTTTDDGWSDAVEIQEDGVYAIKLPEGNYAKVRVADITGFAPNRQIQVVWAYQTIPSYPSF